MEKIASGREGKTRCRWRQWPTPSNSIFKLKLMKVPKIQNLDINTDEPSKLETIATIKSLKNNKTPGNDNLPAEIFKPDLILAADILYPLFCKIWKNNMIPTTWSEGNIVKLPRKWDLTDCNSWRGINYFLYQVRFSVNRIETAVDSKLRKEQAGFRKGKSYSDQFVILGT